ncbi:tetrapyrrole biosynthesis, uroporphyrinogen III synthase [Aspergillus sclerotioniger CBS 115572]|uniref:Tetrapyrrole biosynthesis, uroporphyrinogen III synthase n=1 Tax=Aspergillus sclerotioniger CBS 115572 TaxID=1450535 RepID=A0A317X741_9EURO|nr:tetrapyrrole biosynthesis, uroporphyrinogen III synthase [Aspergillus sclerotioniger CBS 115572]PWY94436.1 tetrapyrrole biosynthesis, uroporphyrinogen III synthase [Aspergillus sclerotioniger CBS 115572]
MDEPTPSILLLKTKSIPNDGYDEFFIQNNYTPTFIPVLEHHFHVPNLQSIRSQLTSGALIPGPGRKYGGLIFTSQRAVEAFASVLGKIDGATKTQLQTLQIPIYTVGPATHRTLTSLILPHLPKAHIHGKDTGNGENLARFILEHYNSLYPDPSSSVAKPPLLFLVGEQRRDIIPKTLMDDGLPAAERIGVEEVVVYETGVMTGFEEMFGARVERERAVIKRIIEEGDGEGWVVWVVVFSPTGGEGMLKGLGLLGNSQGQGQGGSERNEGGEERRFFVATIGPTTRDYLRDKFGFEADVCAEKPSPEGVGKGIERFMKEWRAKRGL